MKALLTVMMTLMLSGPAFAESFYGQLVDAPTSVKVVDKNGTQAEYAITAILNSGSINEEYKSVSLSHNGMMARCGDYLGQLAEDFSMTILTDKGARKTATVRAANGEDRKVSVFGMCEPGTNVLEQLQLDVQSGEGFEVQ